MRKKKPVKRSLKPFSDESKYNDNSITIKRWICIVCQENIDNYNETCAEKEQKNHLQEKKIRNKCFEINNYGSKINEGYVGPICKIRGKYLKLSC